MKRKIVTAMLIAVCALLCMVATSAFAVEPESGQVIVFDNPQCQGSPYMVMKVGEYPNMGAYKTAGKDSPGWNDAVSCMKIGDGVRARVFKDTNYKGLKKGFAKTTANKGVVSLANDPWDNSISSMKIVPIKR